MHKIDDEIKRVGGEVLVVSFAPPAAIAAHLAMNPQPFPVLSDPERKAYSAFALGKTSLLTFFRLDVVWHYLRLIFCGWKPKRPQENADIWQLGGDFIIDRVGKLAYAHPSGDATDRPSNDKLLDAIRKAS